MSISPTGTDDNHITPQTEPNSDIQALRSTFSFLKSVILSGESWRKMYV